MSDVWITLIALATAVLTIGGLSLVLRSSQQWLVACLLLALAYLSISLGLEKPGAPAALEGVRWGLLGATLGAWVRFRWRHRFSPEATQVADGASKGPEEQ